LPLTIRSLMPTMLLLADRALLSIYDFAAAIAPSAIGAVPAARECGGNNGGLLAAAIRPDADCASAAAAHTPSSWPQEHHRHLRQWSSSCPVRKSPDPISRPHDWSRSLAGNSQFCGNNTVPVREGEISKANEGEASFAFTERRRRCADGIRSKPSGPAGWLAMAVLRGGVGAAADRLIPRIM